MKAKKVFRTDDPELYIVDYKDDATAFNGQKKGTIASKGVVNNKMSAIIFQQLEENGVPTHLVRLLSDRETLVKAVKILPLEVIIRNVAAGSFSQKYGVEEGRELAKTVLEFSYKNDSLGDPMINDDHILALGLATQEQLDTVRKYAFMINDFLKDFFLKSGLKLIDFKIEFGLYDGEVILADEISPDTCRLWDVRTGEKSPLDILFAFFGSYGRSKELEAHLREWENRYQLVLENAGELILMTDEEGRIVDANLSAVKLLGAESAASLEKRPLFPRLRVISPPEFQLDRVPAAPVRFRCILDEQSSRAVTLACTLSPIRLRGQTLLVLIGSDITEETRLAAEKERLSEQLTHSQRIESLGLLAGGIAHDFNNYIHAILGHVDVITLLYPPENPEVTAHLEKISGIAEQAGHLTSQLLGFARKGKYRVTDVDIRKTIESSLALLGPNKRQVEISFRTIPGMPAVRADSLQLQQVLLNLMLNAIDAMEQNEGEQRLTLFAGPATEAPLPFSPPADHPGARPEDYIFIQVADNGCGMDRATIEKAFEPFFTTKPVGRGTGMGLAMVYGTVSHHQGWIQLESTPGAGSNFCIFLPCSGPADSQEKP